MYDAGMLALPDWVDAVPVVVVVWRLSLPAP
jgi:hypothetical protein